MYEIQDLFRGSYTQTFSDVGDGSRKLVKVFPMAEFEEKEELLHELNKAGAGVFFTPNPCKGGRREENVTSIEWVYVDMDNGTKEEMQTRIKASPIKPHIIIESSRSYHLYWRVDCTKIEFDQIIKGLIEFFDGDPAISSPNEVLRFPGFFHMKDPENPFLVKMIYQNPKIQAISADEMLKGYPSTPEAPKTLLGGKESHTEGSDTLAHVKSIPILDVLTQLGVEVKHGFIMEDGKVTSAHVNPKGNYINRFSGKDGSGSTIDACMVYGNMDLKSAIQYLETMLLMGGGEEIDPIDEACSPFTWGTAELDDKFAPIQGDSFIVLAGESGAGKTAWTFDMAEKNAKIGHLVLYLSLEMSSDGILTRVAREYAGITKAQWRDKSKISETDKKIYKRRKSDLKENKNLVAVGFTSGVLPTIQNILAVIKKVKPDLVFIDNFDLIIKKGENQTHEESSMSGQLLSMCKTECVPIILVHHLKKGEEKSEKKMRGINALRGSGKIVHNADMVVMCWRKTVADLFTTAEEKAKFIIAQQKDRDFGDGGIHTCYFYKGSFYDKFQSVVSNAMNVFYGTKD